MLSIRRTRRRLESLVGTALAAFEDRIARRIDSGPAPQELNRGDARSLALEHLRSAWRALKRSGRTDAQVSQQLRVMITQVETGRHERFN